MKVLFLLSLQWNEITFFSLKSHLGVRQNLGELFGVIYFCPVKKQTN